MAVYLKDGEYHISMSGYFLSSKTLVEAIRLGYGWYLLKRHMMADEREDYAAIEAEIERQRTWGAWCDQCNRRTIHGHDGCHRCNIDWSVKR